MKIRFHREFDIFSSKSQEKPRISAKYICITFEQYCMLVTCCACPISPIYSNWVFMLFSNQRLLEWFLWHNRDRYFRINFLTTCVVTPIIVYDMICLLCVYDMFMPVEWYCPHWIFHHMLVSCCACITWPASRSFCYFPTRGCWNGFDGIIETGITTVSATYVGQAISAIVHVMFMLYSSHRFLRRFKLFTGPRLPRSAQFIMVVHFRTKI